MQKTGSQLNYDILLCVKSFRLSLNVKYDKQKITTYFGFFRLLNVKINKILSLIPLPQYITLNHI